MRTPYLGYLLIAGCVLAGTASIQAQNSSGNNPAVTGQPDPAPVMRADKNVPPKVAEAVNAAFPKSLLYKVVPHGEGASLYPYQSCATMFGRGSNGTPDLVAAAFNGIHTEIAMLEYSSGKARVIAAITGKTFLFPNGSCEASMANLADPAQPDSALARAVRISFGGADWYFLWNGKALIDITAPDYEFGPNHAPYTDMFDTEAVDVDHSGAMQIVGRDGDWDKFPRSDGIASTGTWTLFRYNGLRYAAAEKLRFFFDYSGFKTPWTEPIDMHRLPAPTYELTVVNGSRNGRHRVTGATVSLNGATILSPSDINKSVGSVSRIVVLRRKNSITVNYQGGKDAQLYVLVKKGH